MKLKIKYFNIITSLTILIIVSMIGFQIKNLIEIQNKIQMNSNIETKMYLFVNQLIESSNNLSKFSRNYIITKNKDYLNNFNYILKMRNGIAYLPVKYNSVYWNLSKEKREELHPLSNNKIILFNKINELSYSDLEKEKLEISLFYSQKLIKLEQFAFSLLENNNQELAIKTLFSNEYIKLKEESMLPLNHFMDSLYSKNMINNKKLREKMDNYLLLIIFLFLLLIMFLILIEFFIIKKILIPIDNLTKSVKSYENQNYILPNLNLYCNDEIGVLAEEFIKMKIFEKANLSKMIKNEEKLLKNNEEFYFLANHDPLTKLHNKLFFQTELDKSIIKSKNKNEKLALFFLDLDHFKEINDSLGHKIGDEVLKVVGKKLQNIIKSTDVVCRLGGDEFTIIFNNLKNKNDVITLANRIIKELSENILIKEHSLYVTSSIGISIFPDDGENSDDLLKFSDTAMYKAKENGRNNFDFYNQKMTDLAVERVVMETHFRESIKNNDFEVYLQPQYNSITSKIIGMESLVRWNHPTLGFIFPDKFIPLAEKTGLIIQLDRFVMETAIKQFMIWKDNGYEPGVLSMNLSIKQLKEVDFIEYLLKLLKDNNCSPEFIELEVTEGQVMENPEKAINILNEINNLGINLSIDDFGTGYSSLAYLKKLPIHKLKIDRAFVMDLENDEDDRSITTGIISLANSLNIDTIAEGVETEEQKKFLKERGCIKIQGYLYNKPMPFNEMEEVLIENLKETK